MYAVLRRYNTHKGSAEQILQRVNQGFVPIVSKTPGFVAYYVVNAGDELVSVSIFEDKRGADESTRAASEWVRQNLHGLITTAPVIIAGEVGAQHLSTVP
jgi:hypothetical protein